MAEEIVMPRLSDSMEEGTVLAWLKSIGDEVAIGEELVEIETDKANMVFESDAAGTLIEITAQEGDTLPIGEIIARVGVAREAPTADNGAAAAEAGAEVDDEREAEVADETGTETQASSERHPTASGRIKASPLARRIASDKGVQLSELTGSGPSGRIVKADIERASGSGPAARARTSPPPSAEQASAPSPERNEPQTEGAKGAVDVIELTKLQQTVARRMAESKATAPHFYLQAEIEMSRCVEARGRLKASAHEGDAVPSFNDMVVKAVALALREHPRANAAYRDGKLELYSRVNVGVAVAASEALVVPTVFDADRKGLREIATQTRALGRRVEEGTITPPELSGATFTVSNLGMYGVSSFHAVINPPQAAILAVGEIVTKPVVRDGQLATGESMGVTLACDHRILYGADGAALLARIRALLEEPLALAL